MPKGIPNARYTGKFKQEVIEDIQKNKRSEREASSKYEVQRSVIKQWERIYLEEGAEGLYVEQRGCMLSVEVVQVLQAVCQKGGRRSCQNKWKKIESQRISGCVGRTTT